MAAIASISAAGVGLFAANQSTLSASDTITFDPTKVNLLVLDNTTAGLLTATLDGADGTTVTVPGVGVVSVAAGLPLAVPANSSVAVRLNSVSAYCKGIVSLTGGATLKARVFTL